MRRWKSAILAAVALPVLALTEANAKADGIQNFAIFGNSGVTFDGFSTTVGTVGSNADINELSASTNITNLRGLGNFNGIGADQTVTAGMVFNGSVFGGPLSSYGSVDAGGSVFLQGNVTGNLTVGKDLALSTFNKIGGNALVGGSADLSGSNTVTGTLGVNGNATLGDNQTVGKLIYGGTLVVGSSANISSQSHSTVVVQPQIVSPVLIPAATSFVGGGVNQTLPLFASVSLVPGHYGALSFNGSNTLTLSSGNYYFDSIQSAGPFLTLNLNTSSGSINIFVTGNVDLLDASENINGQSFSSANPTLASQICLEAHGSVVFDNVSPANGSDFFGTIFDPAGPITAGVNESFIGSLLSGQSVTLGSNTNVTFEPSGYVSTLAVPEPSCATLAIFAGGLLIGRGRRQRQHVG